MKFLIGYWLGCVCGNEFPRLTVQCVSFAALPVLIIMNCWSIVFRRVMCAFHCDDNSLVCIHVVQRVSSFSRINVSWMCRVNYWLSCCFDCFCWFIVVWRAQFILWRQLACSLTIRAARKFIFANKYFLNCRVNYWLSCCFDCFVVSSSCDAHCIVTNTRLFVYILCSM